jgi:hypothetical protein
VCPRATLQPGQKTQDSCLCTPGRLFRWNTKLRMRVCGAQGDFSGGTHCSGNCLCSPGPLFSRDTKPWICVSAAQGHSSAGTGSLGYQFVHPRAKLQAGRNVCAPQDHSSAGTQDSACGFVYARATLQAGHNAQDASLCGPGPFFNRDTEFKV